MPNRLGTLLIVALAYWVTAQLGLLLAVPPGYATTVWPPSGIALGATLVFGNRVLPGIWLGSFLANAAIDFNGIESIALLLLPLGISLGATLQAGVIGHALRRWVGYPTALTDDGAVIRFLLIGGPIGSCVNSSISVSLLFLSGKVSLIDLPINWIVWWGGDTLGALIFAPIVLIFFGQPRAAWAVRRRTVVLPLCVSFVLATTFFSYARNTELDRIDQEFHELSEMAIRNVEGEFFHYDIAIWSLRALFDSSVGVTREEFRQFSTPMLSRIKGLQAVSWNQRVFDSDRSVFENQQKSDTIENFGITEKDVNRSMQPAARRDEYVVVTYIEPLQNNRPALGYDVASELYRHTALERARDRNELAATAPINLVQKFRQPPGVLLFVPVYRPNTAVDTVEQRREQLSGFVVGVLRVSDLVDQALLPMGKQRSLIQLNLMDKEFDSPGQAFYVDPKFSSESTLVNQKSFDVGGRHWLLTISAAPEEFSHTHTLEYVLVGGMSFCALLGGFLLTLTGRTLRVEALVAERTEALKENNEWLRHEMEERVKAEEALQQFNNFLEQRVQVETRKNRDKDHLIIQQSRLASMGEMIGNIAHQWRQPLNSLVLVLGNIEDAFQRNELTGEYLQTLVSNGEQLIQKMSSTIDDFRHFFRPQKQPEPFSGRSVIEEAVSLVSAGFQNNHIEIRTIVHEDVTLVGFANEFSQVLLNLLNNAKDAILARQVAAGRVSIRLSREKTNAVIVVVDNGGGIPESVLDKIFEPYFSTKEMGTGIGLYMSKMIIENNMNGTISARNSDDGAEFTLACPLASKVQSSGERPSA